MARLFEYPKAQGIFSAVGVTPGQTWDETRERIRTNAARQLHRQRGALKPETDSKWRTLRHLADYGVDPTAAT